MSQPSPVMAVIADVAEKDFVNQVANALGYEAADVVIGTPMSAAGYLQTLSRTPQYILIDIGNRSYDVLPELDVMAENCEADTRVVVIGVTNDVTFYRDLRQRGIIEYFIKPAKINEIRTALMYEGATQASKTSSKVISFMSAASGDGSSTVALNTAYCLAEEFKKPTVMIDMDFQFGMVARNLDLSTPFGIKELFEHPDRAIDSTLVERMLADYGDNLKIIAAPNDLRLMPSIRPETIRDLLVTLQQRFEYVVIDLPHLWSTWIAAALSDSSHIVMVAQLWLRSVTHSARLLGAWRDIGIRDENVTVVVNRSGAKFKEGITSKDYERVCNKKVDFYFGNDIKTIVSAENQGKTIQEVGSSMLARQFREFASGFLDGEAPAGQDKLNQSSSKSPLHSLSSVFSKR
ncbi:MAG: AAA family ATPase [Alphaproteobacteria bacterium]|nr:AAA family ATPase [Alphaproteobacteria bacterium]